MRKWFKIARVVVPVVMAAAEGVRDLRSFRLRLVMAAEAGDLDDAAQIVAGSKDLVESYVENG